MTVVRDSNLWIVAVLGLTLLALASCCADRESTEMPKIFLSLDVDDNNKADLTLSVFEYLRMKGLAMDLVFNPNDLSSMRKSLRAILEAQSMDELARLERGYSVYMQARSPIIPPKL